jgi:hypothetical protein
MSKTGKTGTPGYLPNIGAGAKPRNGLSNRPDFKLRHYPARYISTV